MEHKEDIGKLLKKQLEGGKRAPDGDLWTRINDSLVQKDKRKKRYFFYWFTGAGLTLLLLLILFITPGDSNENSSEHPPVDLTEFSSTENKFEDSDLNSEEVKNVNELSSEDKPEDSEVSAKETKIVSVSPSEEDLNDAIVNDEEINNGNGITSESEPTLTEADAVTTSETNTETKQKNETITTKLAEDSSTNPRISPTDVPQNAADSTVSSTIESTTKTTDPNLKIETSNSVENKIRNEAGKATGIISTTAKNNDLNSNVKTGNDLNRKETLDSLKVNHDDPIVETTGNSTEILSQRDSLIQKRLAVRDSVRSERIAFNDSLRNQRTKFKDSLLKERLEVKDSLLKKRSAVKDSLAKIKVAQDSSVVEEVKEPEYLWDFSIIGAPSYFGISNSGSAIDGQFEGADKTGSFGISYGAAVNLAILERFTLSLGALKTSFSNTTNDIAAASAEERNRILSFTDTEFDTFSGFLGDDDTVSILQDIEYVEMPFHLKYRLGGTKLGFHVYGGFSTYILVNDEVLARNSTGDNLSLGRASRLSPINISMDGGLGFYYNFSETLGLEINPTYKYHLNTITAKTFNGRTYSMGVYSGLRYKF